MKHNKEKITGDNRRPGMKSEHTYLVRYDLGDYGWRCCATFIDEAAADNFIKTL